MGPLVVNKGGAEVDLRDAEIDCWAHRGNIRALASEFELTERHIWRICRQQRKLHLDEIQGRLFED